MNISHREITIIVIIFIIFLLYLYYTKSIEPFESNKALENTYKDIIKNLYDNIESELNIINSNSEIMKSVCNIIKNNGFNLKKISQSQNLRMKINKMIENINEIELLIKKNSTNSLNILSNFIISQSTTSNN